MEAESAVAQHLVEVAHGEVVVADVADGGAGRGVDVEAGVLLNPPGAAANGFPPGTIEHWMHNEHYGSEEDFLMAIADAMHEEYKAITDAGLIVQIDDPDLADGWRSVAVFG